MRLGTVSIQLVQLLLMGLPPHNKNPPGCAPPSCRTAQNHEDSIQTASNYIKNWQSWKDTHKQPNPLSCQGPFKYICIVAYVCNFLWQENKVFSNSTPSPVETISFAFSFSVLVARKYSPPHEQQLNKAGRSSLLQTCHSHIIQAASFQSRNIKTLFPPTISICCAENHMQKNSL